MTLHDTQEQAVQRIDDHPLWDETEAAVEQWIAVLCPCLLIRTPKHKRCWEAGSGVEHGRTSMVLAPTCRGLSQPVLRDVHCDLARATSFFSTVCDAERVADLDVP